MTAIQEAEQAGFDLSLVDESLRCSPEQRALQHQTAWSWRLNWKRKDSSSVTEINRLLQRLSDAKISACPDKYLRIDAPAPLSRFSNIFTRSGSLFSLLAYFVLSLRGIAFLLYVAYICKFTRQ